MKVKAYVGLEVEVEIDDRFKVLDVDINETPDCEITLYEECLEATNKAVKSHLIEHLDPIFYTQYCEVNGVESIETGNTMAES